MINDKLKRLRIENNYTQQQIAKLLGYKSRFSIYKKEKGQRSFSLQDIKKLLELYNISPNELLKEEGEENEKDISESK
ncbi:TPA: helix-turn-helix transcriptional regulator [Clostridioides difficile]